MSESALKALCDTRARQSFRQATDAAFASIHSPCRPVESCNHRAGRQPCGHDGRDGRMSCATAGMDQVQRAIIGLLLSNGHGCRKILVGSWNPYHATPQDADGSVVLPGLSWQEIPTRVCIYGS